MDDKDRILKTEYSDEMSKSYIDYAMSVITARALPDIRDGLKPVQRRILYDMDQLHVDYDKPFRKCARIVGDTMGKYHPHGDSSIYDALVIMSQDFKKEVPIIDGHGNFGSIEGDGAAAMRYTEARLQKITQETFLANLDPEIVEFIPNFDETEAEPMVLPVKIPNFLINGSEGIAVGMTTSTPSHNLGEALDAECYLIQNPDASTEELLNIVKGPDFPTGGIVINKKELLDIYNNGTGKIKLRAKMVIEYGKRKVDKDRLIITEIPFTMIGSGLPKLFSDLEQLMKNKDLPEVVDVTNSSGKDGIRIVLELKKGADIERVKNILYTKTRLEDTFGVNMLAIMNGKPETLSLKKILQAHIDFLVNINTKIHEKQLKKAIDRKEIVEGLMKAYDVLDLIINILRNSKTVKDAKKCLMTGDSTNIVLSKEDKENAAMLNFSEAQTNAILEMKLQRLVGLEIKQLRTEEKTLSTAIKNHKAILKSRKLLMEEIVDELQKIKKEYAVTRKTEITDAEKAVAVKKAVTEDPVVLLINRFGYCKTMDANLYEKNKDSIMAEHVLSVPCKTSHKLCMFTNKGKLYRIRVDDIPLGKSKDKGVPLDNLVSWDDESYLSIWDETDMAGKKLLFVTKNGYGKITDSKELESNNKAIAATKLSENDELILVKIVDAEDIQFKTNTGVGKKLKIDQVKEYKKTALGTKVIKLKQGDILQEVIHESTKETATKDAIED